MDITVSLIGVGRRISSSALLPLSVHIYVNTICRFISAMLRDVYEIIAGTIIHGRAKVFACNVLEPLINSKMKPDIGSRVKLENYC
jgi:hypothetical protein